MSTESPGETLAPPQVEATMKSIPDAIAVPPGNEVFLLGHARLELDDLLVDIHLRPDY